MHRHTMYGLVHKGVKALLIQRLGFYDDDEYRNHLGLRTGKTSCKAMSDTELRQLVACLTQEGFLASTPKGRPGGRGPARPTDAQWAKLAALSRERGWKGLDDEALDKFVQRTVKLSKTRFLTRQTISQVMVGLERWQAGGLGDKS